MVGMDFSAALSALNKFLQTHPNKVVVAFQDHDLIPMREFFVQETMWQMLKTNGFTDSFIELSPSQRTVYDQLVSFYALTKDVPQKPGLDPAQVLQTKYKVAAQYAAEKNGLRTTFVDQGISSYPFGQQQAFNNYNALVSRAWGNYIRVKRINLNSMSIEAQADAFAAFIRAIINTSEGAEIKQALERYKGLEYVHLARVEDEATGKFVQECVPKAEGRIWLNYGSAHFTPCGVHTYLDNPLLLKIYIDRTHYLSEQASIKNRDVLPGAQPKPAWEKSYVLLLKEGELFESPAQSVPPDRIAAEREDWLTRTKAAKQRIPAQGR